MQLRCQSDSTPTPYRHTHIHPHTYTHEYPDSLWLCQMCLAKLSGGCFSAWLRDKDIQTSNSCPVTNSHIHLCCCHAAFTFCKRFTVPASDGLTAIHPRCQSPCQSPAATHRWGDKTFTGATSNHSPCSFLTAITPCKLVMKSPQVHYSTNPPIITLSITVSSRNESFVRVPPD